MCSELPKNNIKLDLHNIIQPNELPKAVNHLQWACPNMLMYFSSGLGLMSCSGKGICQGQAHRILSLCFEIHHPFEMLDTL
jgi:hypothetical protein